MSSTRAAIASCGWSGFADRSPADLRKKGPRRRSGGPSLVEAEDSAPLLDQAQDVAVRILEPGGLESTLADIQVALLREAGQIIFFEEDALVLELADFLVDVVDVEGQRGGLVGAGEFGAIDVDQRVAALQRHAFAPLVLALEAQLVLIEFARPVEVRDRNHRCCVGFSKHDVSSFHANYRTGRKWGRSSNRRRIGS